VSLSLLSFWPATALLLEQYGKRARPEGRYDAIIVAGCRVDSFGVASPALCRRVEKAVALWEEGFAPLVVFTGGRVKSAFREADIAGAYAETLGVPKSAIRLESNSINTEENAKYAAELFPCESVLVVTDSYHILRCQIVFGRYFSKVGMASVVPDSVSVPQVSGAMREVVAVGMYSMYWLWYRVKR
jgi:uncharacterized SAM-binding protein YcdF (DUF218 family)